MHVYARQLIYYGVSPPRKNASVFYGDKSSLKHFASIDLSANRIEERPEIVSTLDDSPVSLSFFCNDNPQERGSRIEVVSSMKLILDSTLQSTRLRSISRRTITMDRRRKIGEEEVGFNYFSPRDYDLARISCGQEHRD